MIVKNAGKVLMTITRGKKEKKKVQQDLLQKKKRASYWDRLSFLDGAEEERDCFSNVPPELSGANMKKEPKISEIAVKQQT